VGITQCAVGIVWGIDGTKSRYSVNSLILLAHSTGFEPVTSAFGGLNGRSFACFDVTVIHRH
jgi:hypothetical protein